MQIEIMSGSRTDDASDLIGFVIAGLKQTEHGMPIVQAGAYAIAGLIEILEVRAARGEREILVQWASREQIQAVLAWSRKPEYRHELEDLLIHLMGQDPSERNAG